MIDSQKNKQKGLVKRNSVADQCNRGSNRVNAGAFPRMGMNPTRWCSSPQNTARATKGKSTVVTPALSSQVYFPMNPLWNQVLLRQPLEQYQQQVQLFWSYWLQIFIGSSVSEKNIQK